MTAERQIPALGKLLWVVVIIAAFKTVWCGFAAFWVLLGKTSHEQARWPILLLVTAWPVVLILVMVGSKWAIVPGVILLGEAGLGFWNALDRTYWTRALPTEMLTVFWRFWLGAFTIQLFVLIAIIDATRRRKLA